MDNSEEAKSSLNKLLANILFLVLFVNSWWSTMLYHKIDPGSTSETEKFAAWTNVCFSDIYFCNKWICLCFHHNSKKLQILLPHWQKNLWTRWGLLTTTHMKSQISLAVIAPMAEFWRHNQMVVSLPSRALVRTGRKCPNRRSRPHNPTSSGSWACPLQNGD